MANYRHKGSVHVFEKVQPPPSRAWIGWLVLGFIVLGLVSK